MERTQTITAIILHDSDGCSLKDSMHFIIAPEGNVIKCVDVAHQAPHIREGNLHGQRDVNDFSIGIALVVSEGEGEKYNEAQFASLITLIAELAGDYRIPLNRIVGHDHVESANDPGESFPWFEFLNSVGSIVEQEAIAPSADNGSP